jgi:hypothetical protein
MKLKKTITLSIKGRDWVFTLLTDRAFDKLHNTDESNETVNTAMTLPNKYEVHFRKSDWCLVDIRHELGHVLFAMDHNNAAGLTPGQVEEIMCEIIARNHPDIGMWTDRIAEKFFGEE